MRQRSLCEDESSFLVVTVNVVCINIIRELGGEGGSNQYSFNYDIKTYFRIITHVTL